MFNVLIDTSVWLDLAENSKQTPLLDPLIAMLSGGYLKILVPQTRTDRSVVYGEQ